MGNINALLGIIKIFYRREKEKQSFRREIQEQDLSALTLCSLVLCGKLFHQKNKFSLIKTEAT
jgi:hypothetical protein